MLINIKNLSKNYGDLKAIDNLDLSVDEGEILGVLGKNGAGKSTLINTMLRLLSFETGSIEVFGKNLLNKEKEIKKYIGYVPQEIAIYDELSAYDNVAFFGKLYGLKGEVLKANVQKALEFTELWDKRKNLPTKFSGGMKRRLNIACAIVHKPKLLFMDEPTVGVDPESRNNILESIKKLNKEGTTVIYTSHYMEEIEAICSRVVILDCGKIIAEGTSDQIKDKVVKDQIVKVFITGDENNLSETLKSLPGVINTEYKDNLVTIQLDKSSSNFSNILSEIARLNIEVTSINIERPTLERAFLELTGKNLSENE